MPPFFPKPPPPPILRPRSLFIYSNFTLKKSLKNYPKHFKCLKIETKSSRDDNFQNLSKSRLKALQRRAKSLKTLDLEKHKQFLELKVSAQALGFIKSCNNISSLKLSGNPVPKDLTDFSWIILGYLPNASHDQSQNSLLLKSHLVRHQKKWTYPSSLPFKSLDSIIFRSSLKKPLFSPKSLLMKFRFNLFDLHSQLYHVKIPLPFIFFLRILPLFPNPHKIIHLTTFIPESLEENDKYALKLGQVIDHFPSLRSLNLGIYSSLCISTLSKYLKTPSNICKLSLYLPIQKQKELIELALFIGGLKNLSLLAIVNSKSIQGYAGKGHRMFFTQISGLTQLKSLKIILNQKGTSPPESKFFYGCLGEFAGCLGTLHALEEIKFVQSEIGIAPEFDSLADVLKKRGSKLRKLKLKFFNGRKKIDHLKKLNRAFRSMENLEELSLKGLWTEKESTIQFGQIVSELKWIRSVKLGGENPCLRNLDFVKTLKRILMKYGLEELKWFENMQIYELNYLGRVMDLIDMKEIIWTNPRLYNICLDSLKALYEGLAFKNLKNFLPGSRFV